LTHRRHLEALTWVSRLKIKQLAPQEPWFARLSR
jgi:hypothetical protein